MQTKHEVPVRTLLFIALMMPLAAVPAAEGPPSIRFRNVAETARVPFVLENSATPDKHLI